jgi:hypothetical protein
MPFLDMVSCRSRRQADELVRIGAAGIWKQAVGARRLGPRLGSGF